MTSESVCMAIKCRSHREDEREMFIFLWWHHLQNPISFVHIQKKGVDILEQNERVYSKLFFCVGEREVGFWLCLYFNFKILMLL